MLILGQKFEQYFKPRNIVLPERDLANRSPGFIAKAGWSIRYIFGKDGDREYLEFYAMHRMTDDRHVRKAPIFNLRSFPLYKNVH